MADELKPDLVFKDDLRDLDRLNPNQVMFIAEYLASGSIKEASLKAGYSASYGHNLLKMPAVIEAISLKRQEKLRNLEVTAERVLMEIAKMAYFNPKDLYRDDGSMKEIIELDDEVAAAILEVTVQEEYSGRGEERENTGRTKKYKWHNKKDALELLGRYLKLWTDKVEVVGPDILVDKLRKARMSMNKEVPQLESAAPSRE